jgi:hypothetical protein
MTVRQSEHAFMALPHEANAMILLGCLISDEPAVRVDLQAYGHSDPAYTDPAILRRLGAELLQAATYLERKAKK